MPEHPAIAYAGGAIFGGYADAVRAAIEREADAARRAAVGCTPRRRPTLPVTRHAGFIDILGRYHSSTAGRAMRTAYRHRQFARRRRNRR